MDCLYCRSKGVKKPKLFCSPNCETKWLRNSDDDVE
jgi:hypothetical protein